MKQVDRSDICHIQTSASCHYCLIDAIEANSVNTALLALFTNASVIIISCFEGHFYGFANVLYFRSLTETLPQIGWASCQMQFLTCRNKQGETKIILSPTWVR